MSILHLSFTSIFLIIFLFFGYSQDNQIGEESLSSQEKTVSNTNPEKTINTNTQKDEKPQSEDKDASEKKSEDSDEKESNALEKNAEIDEKNVTDEDSENREKDDPVDDSTELDEAEKDEFAPWNLPPTIKDQFGLEFVLIQPGEFSYEHQDETIEYPFYIQKTELSQENWASIVGSEEWKNSKEFQAKPSAVGQSKPVVYVSFLDVQAFINIINSKYGKPDYRLPTQEEIAYATSAGISTKYMSGEDYSGLSPFCWYRTNSDDLKMVGIKNPNSWGIYDLNGNAWEWTMERGDDFTKSFPLMEDGEPNIRVKHGGSYMSEPAECSVQSQTPIPINMREEDLGFRLVRRVVEDEF
tara:strand:- start:506 stop:1570 length:1065 start_codon:yes stop_codon:yes gene_type:complete